MNSLAQERLEVILIQTRTPNVTILDQYGSEIQIQINPVWNITEPDEISNGLYHDRVKISVKEFEILFVIHI